MEVAVLQGYQESRRRVPQKNRQGPLAHYLRQAYSVWQHNSVVQGTLVALACLLFVFLFFTLKTCYCSARWPPETLDNLPSTGIGMIITLSTENKCASSEFWRQEISFNQYFLEQILLLTLVLKQQNDGPKA